MQRGEKIQAIKIFREQTGVGLAEAKAAVEQIERTGPGPAVPPKAADLEKQVLDLMAADRKIAAIKVYREQTGAGLKEAKDAVEALAARHGIAPVGTGCFGMLVLVLAAALAGATWTGV
ncbi:MAG: ribosomal protein L7/L12 [Planctomycetia bacterium]|nr:ribosomal protein L7/L12 [Planctomycetia bacterium]